ncbi:hypothetical protein [Rhodalgimonas zhirmunskyi]|uniref:DUF4019 domain-containing protein n=1 Tax=Rhodalgimonas zhirmunskyi TaxID=2964767 RepID=A0AAJ1U6Z1_9RHOB|nr:hypothetical protein [Rhodoalgimonas zhirmunskyi]MDQ2092775.1 hypothetical protein [Rhodoalgimonas zhirmunskyi]
MTRRISGLFALVLSLAFLFASNPARAQEADSIFKDYNAYAAYTDEMIATRQWTPFIQRMGGRDEYTPEQLSGISGRFNSIFRSNFTKRTVFMDQDLGGGMRREIRAYYGPAGYVFFYAIMHAREDSLIVLNFSLNTKVEAIMERF